MLNQEEQKLLDEILAQSPKPNVQYLIPVNGTDPAALERLVYLGLVVKKGFNPVHCQITEKGRQYVRDLEKEQARIAEEAAQVKVKEEKEAESERRKTRRENIALLATIIGVIIALFSFFMSLAFSRLSSKSGRIQAI